MTKFRSLHVLITLSIYVSVSVSLSSSLCSSESSAKVRPSDINHPTDHLGLGRGYAPPSALFDAGLWGGVGGADDPYQSRSQTGFFFNIRSPFESGELGLSWGMFSHNYENLVDDESGVYTANIAIDWRWRGGERELHDPFIGLGISMPTRSLSGEGGLEGEAQLDAYRIALASRFGGQNRWLWEPNTASAFLEMGGRSTWSHFILQGDLGAAYMYRVIESTEIESANVFVQASGALGFQGALSGLLIGGGYALTPTSLVEDIDQLHAQATYSYLRNDVEYYVSLFVPIDAPAGILGDQMGATALIGARGEM